MKRLIAIILIAVMIFPLIGCIGTDSDTDNKNGTVDENKNGVLNEYKDLLKELNLPLVWTDAVNYIDEKVPYSPKAYKPSVPKYEINDKLSNVANISRFSGFSKNQTQQLIDNGFLVLDPNPSNAFYHMKMYDVYETNQYLEIPNYITVDTALHMYHKFFAETLKDLEKEQLYEALQQLTVNMLNKSIKLYNHLVNNTDKSNSNVGLVGDTSRNSSSIDDRLIQDLQQTMAYFAVANKLINNSYGDIPAEQLAIAQAEIDAIEEAFGFAHSLVFGYDVNYEQFIVRGHYAGDELLESYFKTMMWYGLNGFQFKNDDGEWDFDSIAKSLLITYMTFLELNSVSDIELWDKIYAPTNFFVGQSDDLTIFDLQKLLVEVYGKDITIGQLYDEKYRQQLTTQLAKLPTPNIQHKLITGAVDTPTDIQFRFMGQRYTLDANILQELMFPVLRPIPTGLDVAGVFGNERALELVKADYLDNIPTEIYDEHFNKMQTKVSALQLSDWQQNLYNGWLWVLNAVWDKPQQTTGLPGYMTNQAWGDKKIQSGLGSYAELKHDTILYSKQPAAERGGGEEIIEFYPNFVEPEVEAYERLIWLVKYSKVNLDKRGLLEGSAEAVLTELESMYGLLRDIAIKQLENKPLTNDENELLKFIGSQMERVDMILSAQDFNRSISSAIIADVAAIVDEGSFLEVATGLPNDIYVVAPYEGKLYLARGVTYSYYEFVSDEPLTDEKWRSKLGIEKEEFDDWAYERLIPEKLLKGTPPQPTWYQSFKSSEPNRVKISPVEYRIR